MAKQPNVFKQEGKGWFIQLADHLEGPLDSREEAQRFLNLILLTCAARKEIACLDKECLA